MITQARFVVSGRVQGVFYRASTREKAENLGLTGWVRNKPNGDVELVARGESDSLQALEGWLWQGPRMASVSAVRREAADDIGEENGAFRVRRTG